MIESHPELGALSRLENPLSWTNEKSAVLLNACRELCAFHEANSPTIAHLYRRHKFSPASLETEKDLERIPLLGVSAMKQFLVISRPESEAVLKLTSSGTKGQKTQIWFDAQSLERVQRMLRNVWREEKLVSETPTNYLMFIYDASQAKDLGTAFTRKNQQQFAPPKNTHYAIRQNAAGDWEFNKEAVWSALQSYVEQGDPVRLCGIPGFVNEFLDWIPEGKSLSLPAGSYVITGGGWKTSEDKRIPKPVFRQKLADKLGLVEANIRDGFGMAEHSAPCVECDHHRFHVPAYSRFIVRNPANNQSCRPGEVGLLSLLTAYNTMMPNVALMSTDVGYIEDSPCPCGKNSPTFMPVGRGGLTKHKGCALTAAEIVKRV